MRYIEIKYKRNGHVCRIIPNFTLTKIKSISIPNNLKSYLANTDLIICESNPFISQDERNLILTRELEQFTKGDVVLKDVISEETYERLDSLLANENIPISGLSYWKPWTIAHSVIPKYILKKERINVIDFGKYFRENISIDKCIFISNCGDKQVYYNKLLYVDQEDMLIDAINNYFDPKMILQLIEYNDSGDFLKMNELVTLSFQDPLGQKFQKELYQPMSNLIKQEIIQNLRENKNVASFIDINVIFGDFGIYTEFINNDDYDVKLF